MYSLGYDIGSSSVKCALLEIETGIIIAQSFFPQKELTINVPHEDWAEQKPQLWWECLKNVTKEILLTTRINPRDIKSIGISYQMHGLVIVDENQNILRPAIIWCDSRAVAIGDKAFKEMGTEYCLNNLLNAPGNFTASKLRWVRENKPEIYNRIFKAMLPGDYIAMKFTGEINTTIPGLSEGIFWDFNSQTLSRELLRYYDIDKSIIPDIKNTFSIQGTLTSTAAEELGLLKDTPVSFRAGDQPTNALSLNVLNPGEVAATAGTSGVIYAVTDRISFDPHSRVNSFAHVNHTNDETRLGVLLCINGTGSANSWVRKNFGNDLSYEEINKMALHAPVGAEGLIVLPFGNGYERMLSNKNPGCSISNINFNRHSLSHIFRAAHEGIAFSFKYGMHIVKEMGVPLSSIRAGKSGLFRSEVFTRTLSNISNTSIDLYNTDGAQGAARGAALGAGLYKSFEEAFASLKQVEEIEPDHDGADKLQEVYGRWLEALQKVTLSQAER